MTLSYRDIADILKSIDESQAEEIEIEVEGFRLAVKKRGTDVQFPSQRSDHVPAGESLESDTVNPMLAPQPIEDVPVIPNEPEAPPGHEIIRAPMVGTFYKCPDPESEPFVVRGSVIQKGDPLCLIEVMKLYTTVESTTSGTVISIFAEDGKLVDFNQQLFLIKKESDS